MMYLWRVNFYDDNNYGFPAIGAVCKAANGWDAIMKASGLTKMKPEKAYASVISNEGQVDACD